MLLLPNVKYQLFLFLIAASFLFCDVEAVSLNQCLSDVIARNPSLTGGTDSYGHPVNANATGLAYAQCLIECSDAETGFEWPDFSHQFSGWLLPWLALISQLPYGSESNWDNLMTMLLTVGSPTLAAYTLIMTLLNGQWVSSRFEDHSYPNTANAIRILRSLQQSPLNISRDPILLASLVVLPQNNEWWDEFYKAINYTHTWNISASTSIFWVVIAYIFTYVDSFVCLTTFDCRFDSDGLSVGSSWLWLLPIVIGWLQLSPKCDMKRLDMAFERANRIAYRATPTGVVLADEISGHRAFSLQKHIDSENFNRKNSFPDEERSPPIFNYARVFCWTQSVEQVGVAFRQAARNACDRIAVDAAVSWVHGAKTGEIVDANRIGTAEQVINYCKMPVVQRSLSRWGDVLERMLVASFFALALQWGTTGAAVIAIWFTPATGLGCRSAGYILFGSLSTIVWIMLVSSSMLAHYSTFLESSVRGRPGNTSHRIVVALSTILRRTGKIVASINAAFLVVSSILQFSKIYETCFCASNVVGLGIHNAYVVVHYDQHVVSTMRTAQGAAAALSGVAVIIFIVYVRLFIKVKPSP